MATKINTDIWGAESSWIDVNNPPEGFTLSNYVFSGTPGALQSIDAKLAYLPKTGYPAPANEYYRCSWRGAFLGKQYNPDEEEKIVLDYNSPVPISQLPVAWGIGKDSAIANPIYVLGGYRSGTSTDIQQDGVTLFPFSHDLYRDIQKKTIPFCFSTAQKNTTSTQLNYQNRNYQLPAGASYINYNGQLGGQPIMSFNYQKIVVYPVLIVGVYDNTSPTGISGIQECTISDYFDGATPIKNTKPLILSIIIKYWYMGAETQTANGRSQIDRSFFAGISGGVFYEQEQDNAVFMYNGNEQPVTSVVRDGSAGDRGFQSIVSNIAPNGVIAGGLGTLAPEVLTTIIANSHVDEENRAWIVATQTNPPLFRTAYLNGKFKVHMQQYKNPNNTYTNQIYWCTVWDTEIDPATKDDILKEVAYLGFWFSEDLTVARTGKTGTACDSSLMHIPVFDSDGVTTGQWKSGTDAAQEPNATWNNPYEDNPYVPSGGGGDDDDFGDLNNHIYRGLNFYNLKMYALTEVQLLQFLSTVNAMYTGDNDTLQMDLDFKGSNPNDYIIGLYGYPFDIPNQTSLTTINLGPVDTGVQCRAVADDFYGELSFGSMFIAPYYNDFRDYEPYTSIELYVPLCGSVKLDPALYIGHTINLYYVFDPSTGNLSAKICRDNMVDKILDGSICVQIPITSANMGDYQRSIHQIKTQILKTAIDAGRSMLPSSSFVMSAMSENIGGMISSAPKNPISVGIDVGLKAGEIRYELTHTQPHISTTGTADPLNALNMDNHAFVFIKRAKMLQGYDADIYSHTVGNACIIQSLIGDMSGLIKCSNVDLSGIPATADEISAIQTALQNGIYV